MNIRRIRFPEPVGPRSKPILIGLVPEFLFMRNFPVNRKIRDFRCRLNRLISVGL